MLTATLVISLLTPILPFNVEQSSTNSNLSGKTNPGFTVFEKDGQFLRVIGPLYGAAKIDGVSLPAKLSKPYNISASFIPTIEIHNVYLYGELSFEGSILYRADGETDACISAQLECPLVKGVPKKFAGGFVLEALGGFPGWYEGHFEAITIQGNQRKLRILGIAFKIKVEE